MKKLIIFTAILCLNSLLFAEKIYHPATIKISPKYSTTLYSDDNAKIEIAGDNYVRITFNGKDSDTFRLEEEVETKIENPVVLNPLLDCERCVILRDVDNDGNQEYIFSIKLNFDSKKYNDREVNKWIDKDIFEKVNEVLFVVQAYPGKFFRQDKNAPSGEVEVDSIFHRYLTKPIILKGTTQFYDLNAAKIEFNKDESKIHIEYDVPGAAFDCTFKDGKATSEFIKPEKILTENDAYMARQLVIDGKEVKGTDFDDTMIYICNYDENGNKDDSEYLYYRNFHFLNKCYELKSEIDDVMVLNTAYTKKETNKYDEEITCFYDDNNQKIKETSDYSENYYACESEYYSNGNLKKKIYYYLENDDY